jgi:syntaxin-binding protein 5
VSTFIIRVRNTNSTRRTRSRDRLFNADAVIPPRPTISNIQWISGTQYVSPTDLDLLIGGPERQPSARQIAATREQESRAGPSNGKEPEGWGEYMQRQINERTEKLNIMGDSMESVQQNSEGWATDVNKFVSRQKRNVIIGGMLRCKSLSISTC